MMDGINIELEQIQKLLKAPKGQTNKFGGYQYRSCEDILEAVKPLLSKGTILTVSDEILMFNDGSQPEVRMVKTTDKYGTTKESVVKVGGSRFYVKATATLSNGKDSISSTAYAREAEMKAGMDEAQITGSASSYARKYALNGLFCIDDTKDSDYTNKHGKDEKESVAPIKKQVLPEKKVASDGFIQSEAQRKMLFALVTEAGLTTLQMKELLKSEYNLESSSELTRLQFEEIITFLNDEIKRNKEQQQPL